MQIEIKEKSKILANIYGKELTLAKPTVGQVEQLQSEMAKSDPNQQIPIMKKWAGQLGLPIALIEDMEIDHFVLVVEQLTGVKKK